MGAGFKSAGTLCAAALSLVGTLQLNPVYGFFLAAQVLHAFADYCLEFHFGTGVLFFLLGHICYISGFLKLYPLSVAHLILFISFLLLLVVLFFRFRQRLRNHLLPLLTYGVVLCLMAACGIAGGTSSYSLSGLLTALGSALFFFSDYLLFQQLLFPGNRRRDLAVMVVYYLAQLMLGISVLI